MQLTVILVVVAQSSLMFRVGSLGAIYLTLSSDQDAVGSPVQIMGESCLVLSPMD